MSSPFVVAGVHAGQRLCIVVVKRYLRTRESMCEIALSMSSEDDVTRL